MIDSFPKIDNGVARHHILGLIDTIHDEFGHYCLFAGVYVSIKSDDDPPLNPQELQTWE